MTILRFAAIFLSVMAGVLMALVFFNQRSLIYPAPRDYPRLPLPGFQLVHTQTDDGLRLAAFYRPAQAGKATVVFFHGNGDKLIGAGQATRGLAANGNGLLLVEYRGYGGNAGSPDEAGLYRDGDAAMRWLAGQGVTPRETIIFGNSIGSGPATEMATRYPVRALILVSGFSSLPDVARAHMRGLPLAWLIRDQFANVAKIGAYKGPLLIAHGDRDNLVKLANARRLYAARPDATLRIVPGAGHEFVYGDASQHIVTDWVNALPAP